MMMVGSVSEDTVVRTDADQFMSAPLELSLEKERRRDGAEMKIFFNL